VDPRAFFANTWSQRHLVQNGCYASTEFWKTSGHISDLGATCWKFIQILRKIKAQLRAQISAAGRNIKTCSFFDHHFRGFLEHILNVSFIWKPDLKNGYWDVCVYAWNGREHMF